MSRKRRHLFGRWSLPSCRGLNIGRISIKIEGEFTLFNTCIRDDGALWTVVFELTIPASSGFKQLATFFTFFASKIDNHWGDLEVLGLKVIISIGWEHLNRPLTYVFGLQQINHLVGHYSLCHSRTGSRDQSIRQNAGLLTFTGQCVRQALKNQLKAILFSKTYQSLPFLRLHNWLVQSCQKRQSLTKWRSNVRIFEHL